MKAKQNNYYGDYVVDLTWDDVSMSNYNDYEIYRSTSKTKGYKLIDTTYRKDYRDETVSKNKTYYYKIRVENDTDSIDIINPFSAPVMVHVVEEPSKVKAIKKSKTSATLSWASNKNVDGYEIHYYNPQTKKYELEKIIKKNTISYTKSKLTNGTTHYFRVRNFKTVNDKKFYSPYSDVLKVKM